MLTAKDILTNTAPFSIQLENGKTIEGEFLLFDNTESDSEAYQKIIRAQSNYEYYSRKVEAATEAFDDEKHASAVEQLATATVEMNEISDRLFEAQVRSWNIGDADGNMIPIKAEAVKAAGLGFLIPIVVRSVREAKENAQAIDPNSPQPA